MIDLHCHLLPGIDDGPRTMDETLALARAAVAAGTTTIAMTPHVNHMFPHVDAALVAEGITEVRAALAAAEIALEVLGGAEVALTRATELDDTELAALTLGGGPYLLVECPNTPSAAGFEMMLGTLQSRGHRILLAHAERIPGFQRDIALVERLVDSGMLVQVTAAAIAGKYGGPVREFADALLRAGLVHDVASDAHSAERRGPAIGPLLEDAGWGSHTAYLALEAPRAILAGERLPQAPPAPAKRRRALFRRG